MTTVSAMDPAIARANHAAPGVVHGLLLYIMVRIVLLCL